MSIISPILIYSQNLDYKPVMFLDYKPKWEHLSIDASLPTTIQNYLPSDQFAHSNIYIREGRMFTSYNLWDNFLDGFYFEVVNLDNGKTEWYDTYYNSSLGSRKYADRVKLIGDKVELTYFKEIYQKKSILPWYSIGIPNKNTYDLNTGDLLDSTKWDLSDTINKRYGIPWSLITSSRSYLYTKGNNYLYNANLGGNDGFGNANIDLESLELGEDRKIIDSIGYNVSLQYPFLDNNVFEIDDTTLFFYAVSAKNENDRIYNNFYYRYSDYRFKPYVEAEVSSLIPPGEFLIPIDNASDYFTVISGLNIDKYRKDYRYITSISRDGKILNQIDLKPLHIVDTGKYINVIRTTSFLTSKGLRTLWCWQYTEEGQTYLQFYWIEPDGSYRKMRRLTVDNSKMAYLAISKFKSYKDNILIQFRFKDSTVRIDRIPTWNSWSFIPLKDLELTEVSDQANHNLNVNVYPNPCTNKLNLEILSVDLPEELVIYSMEGTEKFRQQIKNSFSSLDTESLNLSKGIYLLSLESNHKKLYTTKVVIY